MILDADFKEVDHSLNADFGVVFNVGKGGKGDVDYSLVANALKGNASGSAVALTDISPLAHVLGVKAIVINRYDETAYPLTSGYIRYDTGVVVEHTSYICTKDYVPCGDLQGKTITINKHNSGGTYVGLAWYDENKSYISGVQGAGGYVAMSVPSNAVYLRFTEDAGASEIQLEIGTTATPYKPFADISTAKVQRYGKNPFNIDKVVDEKEGGAYIEVNGNDIIFTYGTTNTNHFAFSCEVDVTPNTDYVISTGKTTSVTKYYVYTDRLFGTSIKANVDIKTGTFNSGNNNKLVIGFYSIQPQRVGTSEVISEIMLIRKDTQVISPEYEPYKEHTTHDINANGTVEGVTSLYPTTTLISDTEGIVLDVEYNRDINKAFAELVNALISLGGNV